ncbi:MAG: hypothetical protein ABJA80_09885 [bacterium]
MTDFTKHNSGNDAWEFGDDADGALPPDVDFDNWIAGVAPSLNAPPSTPRMAMWDAIQAAQADSSAAQAGMVAGVTPITRRRWMVWPAAIAAALLIGIGIDRHVIMSERGSATQTTVVHTARTAPGTGTTPPVDAGTGARRADDATSVTALPHGGTRTGTTTSTGSAAAAMAIASARRTHARGTDSALAGALPRRSSAEASSLYRLAAVQTLTQAEALLTAYRADGLASRNPAAARQLGAWGREVLSSTRLLLDSPAGDDPQLRRLLNDIELVLVQVIRLSGAPLDATDRALIDEAMHERDLLPRIRTAVPAGVAGAASDE